MSCIKSEYYDPLIAHETKKPEEEEADDSAAKRVEKQEQEEEQEKMELKKKGPKMIRILPRQGPRQKQKQTGEQWDRMKFSIRKFITH